MSDLSGIPNQNKDLPQSGFAYFVWENKTFLSILILVLLATMIFIENGVLAAFAVAIISLGVATKRGSWRDIGFVPNVVDLARTLLCNLIDANDGVDGDDGSIDALELRLQTFR